MQSLPHHYKVAAAAKPEGDVSLSADKLESISSAPPAEFGGPGNRWSPENLLVAAVADCFILSFRSIATASKLSWISLECKVEGTLERIEGVTKFTRFEINAEIKVPPESTREKTLHLLEKAEGICLISNSLSAAKHLNAIVTVIG